MPEPTRYEITKYPNRRFYDVTRSRHVTLTDLYDLVRAGHEIVVTDKTNGRDITNIVLTQIILEHDPPKMDLFPASLLHQAIQMNESLVRGFIDQYLTQAMDAFSQSRRQFDTFLRQTGLNPLGSLPQPSDWLRMMMPGMNRTTTQESTRADTATRSDVAPVNEPHSDMRRDEIAPPPDEPQPKPSAQPEPDIIALQRQLAALSEQMAMLKKPAKKKAAKKTGGRKSSRRKK